MKTLTKLGFALLLLAFLNSVTTSCAIRLRTTPTKKGWIKNTNNPHHPKTTNPGHTKHQKKKKKKK